MKKIWAAFLFLRPLNLLMVFAVFWIFEYFLFEPLLNQYALGLTLSSHQLDLLATSISLVAASGYMINDWKDRDIDTINRPNRFLLRYPVSKKVFFRLYAFVIFFGFAFSAYVAFTLDKAGWVWLYPFFVLLMWFYAAKLKLKGVWGNSLVSIAICIIPWLLVLAELPSLEKLALINKDAFALLIYHVFALSICMALANFVREVVKDAQDEKGDSAFGSESIYLKYGVRATRITCVVSVLTLLVIEIGLVLLSPWMTQAFLFCGLSIGILTLIISYKILISRKKSEFSSVSMQLKLLMLFGLLQVAFLTPN